MKLKSNAPKVLFYSVQSGGQKLERISCIAHEHFVKKEPLLFLTDSPASAAYIDTFLWKMPPDSFLPHGKEGDSIQITHRENAPYSGHALFNLTQKPLVDLYPQIKIIYEFEDLTSKEKAGLFTPKYRAYSASAYRVVSL